MNNTMISVIVPVFDSDLSLKELIEGIKKNLDEYSFEIILIDDGSNNPKTWQTINKLSYGNVKGVKLNKNFCTIIGTGPSGYQYKKNITKC